MTKNQVLLMHFADGLGLKNLPIPNLFTSLYFDITAVIVSACQRLKRHTHEANPLSVTYIVQQKLASITHLPI